MTLESGPAKFDQTYYFGFAIACILLAGWFYYDGKWGYIEANRAEARKKLAPLVGGVEKLPQEFGAHPTKKEFEKIAATNPTDTTPYREAFGAPFARATDESGRGALYFVSDYGMITLPVVGERIDTTRQAVWTKWKRGKDEIEQQFYWALLPLVAAVYLGYRGVRAATLRVRIDDEGLTYGGLHIPFAEMTALRDYNKKGWVDLYYKSGGAEQKLRIDNQKVAKFDEIIDALCAAKGFADPRPAGGEDTNNGGDEAGEEPGSSST
ncbi:MAG: hypothetical protein D6744_19085 [Planctomycetota bacterium]|nr:MAG: hypothetical protein D6744_19085 [Planctomycetota bacterium]